MRRFLTITAVVVSFAALQFGSGPAWAAQAKTKQEMLNNANELDEELERQAPDPVEAAPEPAVRQKSAQEKAIVEPSKSITHQQQPGATPAQQSPKTVNNPVPVPVAESKAAVPEKKDGGKCYIATAAYGSYLDPHVNVLREFRDTFLLTNPVGRTFVDFYYSYSPPAAAFISRHESLRTMTRWSLTPVIFGIEHPRMALLGMLLSFGCIAGISFRLRRRDTQSAR
jgi:hypothetical protein